MKLLLAAALFVTPAIARAGKHSDDLQDQVKTATKAAGQIRDNPNLTPEQTREQQKIKDGAVNKIEAIANSDPKDTETQLEAGKGLASVDEGPRAVPFAERGLSLAQASGDPKLIRQALLTGSEVYYKAGNYDLAAKRAQAVLKENPKDRDAMMLYMQVKGRSSTASTLQGSNEPKKDGAGGVPSPNTAAPAQTRPAIAMTSAASLDAQRHIASGWSKIALDPAAALKSFDAAVAADPNSPQAKIERAKARLQTGNANGALADVNAALAIQNNFAEAYAIRADANRALGAAEAAIIADYEQASKLDSRFVGAYNALVTKAAAGTSDQAQEGSRTVNVAGSSAPRSFHMARLIDSPKSWLKLALIVAILCAIASVLVPLALKRRSSEEDSQNR